MIIKIKNFFATFIIVLFFLCNTSGCNSSSTIEEPVVNGDKISLNPDQLIRNNLSACSSPSILIDGNTDQPYHPGYAGQNFYPLKTVVDLKGEYEISQIRIFEASSGAEFKVRAGLTYKGLTEIYKGLLKNEGWKTININKRTRYLELEFDKETGPSEIELYGKLIKKDPTPEVAVQKRLNFETMVGFNANSYIPDSLFWPGTTIRQYDYTEKLMPKEELLRLNPTDQGTTLFDDEYKRRKSKGLDIVPCTFHAPEDIFKKSYEAAGIKFSKEFRPIQYGADPYSPSSYDVPARFGYQLAARWGRNELPNENITVNTKDAVWKVLNEKKSGLDLLNYLELGNEQDRWWTGKGDGRYETLEPLMMAAQNSALYDGHEGKIKLAGIKQADKSMKMVMSALSDMNIDYIKMMDIYAKENRSDKKFPADVINFHYYTTDGGNQYSGKTKAISPERANVKKMVTDFTDYIYRHIPDVEVWWTEFGYETNTNSNFGFPADANGVPLIAEFDTWRLQCAWTLRTFFEVFATGKIQRMVYFQMMNEIQDNEVPNDKKVHFSPQFGTNGFTLGEHSNPKFFRKTAWYGMNNCIQVLSGCSFVEDLSTEKYRMQKWSNGKDKEVLVLWSPTEKNIKLQETIDVEGSHWIYRNVESKTGEEQKAEVKGNKLITQITEMPKLYYRKY